MIKKITSKVMEKKSLNNSKTCCFLLYMNFIYLFYSPIIKYIVTFICHHRTRISCLATCLSPHHNHLNTSYTFPCHKVVNATVFSSFSTCCIWFLLTKHTHTHTQPIKCYFSLKTWKWVHSMHWSYKVFEKCHIPTFYR